MTTLTLTGADADTYIKSSAATSNYGSASDFWIGEDNGNTNYVMRCLMKFNKLSDGTIPAYAIIDSATLSLYAITDASSNARTLRVYRSLRAWVVNQVTWNIWATGSNWATAGGFGATDCEQTDCGSLALSATETINQYKVIPMSASLIQEIVAGTVANNGFLLKVDTELDDAYKYNSSEAASNKPVLNVTYHIGGRQFQVIMVG